MKVLVIGGNGYLGRAYCETLTSLGHDSVVFDLPSDVRNIREEEIAELSPGMVVNFSMIANLKQPQISHNEIDFQTNVEGLKRIIDSVSPNKIPLVQISTREVIGLRDFRRDFGSPFMSSDDLRRVGENEPCFPLHSYGKTKLIAEYLCQGYERGSVVRLNTPYSDDWMSGKGLISVLVKKSVIDAKVRLDNDGRAVRDPLHISDLTTLIFKVIEKGCFQQVINAGGGEQNVVSLLEICQGANAKVQIESGQQNGDFGFLFDISKASELGWLPKVDIRKWLGAIKNH